VTPYASRVLDLVDRIPRGRVMSYGDVAELMGEGSARGVGSVMARYGSETCWHRVLMSDGSLPPGHEREATALLKRERVPMRGSRVDMRAARWDGRGA
jgi:alkylated DNA nucleotide flippase Atl1